MEKRAVSGQVQDEEAVKAFINQCVWLRVVYNEYRALYKAGPSRLELLRGVAANFFDHLNRILVSHTLLGICKVTDPARRRCKNPKSESLTVSYMLEVVGQEVAEQLGLDEVSKRIHSIRKYILPARNKILAHVDKDVVVSGERLGAFPTEVGDAFWSSLQEFVDKLNRHYFGGVFPLDAVNATGAEELVRALKKSVDWDDYFKDKPREKLDRRTYKMRYRGA